MKPQLVGLAAEQRGLAIAVLCVAFVVLLLVFSFGDSSRFAIAWRAVKQSARDRGLWSFNASTPSQVNDAQSRTSAIQQALRNRHGRRWRYRERWLLVTGNEQLVARLSPTLVSTGFVLTAGAVLLYVSDKLSAADQDWLTQIRRLRRRRPIDAVVALTSDAATPALLPPEALAQRLTRIGRALRWAAPVYLLDLARLENDVHAPDEAIGLTWAGERLRTDDAEASFAALAGNLADAGVARLSADPTRHAAAALSQHIVRMHGALCALLRETAASQFWRHPVQGMFFAPLAPVSAESMTHALATDATSHRASPGAPWHPKLWQRVAVHSRCVQGRRVGFSMSNTTAWLVTGAMFVWILGINLSGLHNRTAIESAQNALAKWNQATDQTQQMLALNDLGRQIDTLEAQQRQGAPWATRFGLNRDGAILDAMWPGYVAAAPALLMTPLRHALEARLIRLASLSDAEIADRGNVQADAAHGTLEAYLMMANPARANAAFLTPQFMATGAPLRPNHSDLSPGAWADLRGQTLAFLASHIGTTRNGVSLAMPADQSLVASTRQTIVSVRGIQNSTDALYQKIIDEAQAKYPPVTLTSLLGSAAGHGLFTTNETVPGVYTRAAFEERISRAIDDASARQDVTEDWVLSDAKKEEASESTLKADLRQRYFNDYARAWETFLNSLRWQAAPSLTGTVDQLLLLGDPQRSPMVALVNAIDYQASTGVTSQSLAAGLLDKAQQLVGHDQDPSRQAPPPAGPLADAFGPILRLTGSDLAAVAKGNRMSANAQPAASGSDLSLARYLERVTAMRLKLQQMISAPDPDAMSRMAAQAVLQGKTSEIADSRDYASRVAASLGGQWAGFGTVLQAPLDQAWRVVMLPAAANLNDVWRNGIVADWNRAFGGRYPFADSDNDASLPEMARFMRPDSGIIARFVGTQLAGVIERQGERWVAVQGANRGGLALDPEFVSRLNRLTRVANVLFPSGDAHVRFDLRGVPTPGITDARFVFSEREFHYFNQKEEWMPFVWPGETLENVTRVQWQTDQGGLRSAFDAQGRFGLIRLLERAQVEPQDSARHVLTWTPDQAAVPPLRVQMRSEVSAGPLDVLQLRHFSLPARVFASGSMTPAKKRATPTRATPAPTSSRTPPAGDQ
ncbi:ImcF-related family protein [Pandoraea sp. NPDC087047]|uniref:ImcF-related family protein n=1 Tax=Pandoraea sp. NPDC087047 TaxID=3364390 RepID=UPI00381482E0